MVRRSTDLDATMLLNEQANVIKPEPAVTYEMEMSSVNSTRGRLSGAA